MSDKRLLPGGARAEKLSRLSQRQRDIAEKYASGLTYKQIAADLFIAPSTVRNHLAAIYRELGISNKADLISLIAAASDVHGVQSGVVNTDGYALTAWLRDLSLEQYTEAFAANAIDWQVLPALDDDDLQALGVTPVGHRKRLLQAIAELAAEADDVDADDSTAAENPAQPERRQLTVMFCDLVDSTALAERFDPEDLSPLIRAYQDTCTQVVARFEGHVAKYMGDGIVVYFGWPQAHEDDAERALRAGLAIIDAVGGLKPRLKVELQVRIGVATGTVMVGETIGQGAAQEQTVVGKAPNLAARLQGLGEPNSLVIAASTRQLAGAGFDYADLGEHSLKGFSAPVEVCRVLGARPLTSRFESRVAELTPLAGRQAELHLLKERWSQAAGGEGQVALLSGEPGIGKSRIVHDLLAELVSSSHRTQRYQCTPYHTNTAFYPFVAYLSQQLPADMANDVRLDRLQAVVAEIGEASERAVALLAALLSISTGERYPPLQLSPERQRQETLALLSRLILAGAELQARIIVIEDIHWMDPSSLVLLEQLVDQVQTAAVLLILTTRPEFKPPWADFAHITILSLNRLSCKQVLAMIDGIAPKALPQSLRTHIAGQTDGVPLFVEEMTKAVLESDKVIEKDTRYELVSARSLVVPATLQDALMARLDRLADAKEIAQIGAIIGREFPYQLVAAVSPLSEDLLIRRFDQLVAAGLMYRRGTDPDVTYIFKHALVRDIANQSLIKSRRREIHAKIAETVEERFAEMAANQPELIAFHLTEAGLTERAVGFWIAAGHRALLQDAWQEALSFVEQGFAAISTQTRTRTMLVNLIDLYDLKYSAQYPLGNTQSLLETLAEAEGIAIELNDSVRLSRILSAQAYVLSSNGKVELSLAAGRRAVGLTAIDGDLNEYVMARFMLGRALYAAGQYSEAIRYANEAMAILGNDVERGYIAGGALNQTVSARAWLVLSHAERGEFEQGQRVGLEGLRLAQRVRGGNHERIWMRNAIGRMNVMKGDFAAAIENLDPVMDIAENDFPVYLPRVASSLGTAYAALGRIGKGLQLLRQADEYGQSMRFQFGYALVLAQLAEVLLMKGDKAEAREKAMRAFEVARNAGERGNAGWAACALAAVAAQASRQMDAETYYQQALKIADTLEMAPLRARCLHGLQQLNC